MFDFVDLFAGVGGFHAALAGLGGQGVQAAEIDPHAARVYERNWGLTPVKDVRDLAADPSLVEDHAVLTAGFPCQPFSKSGRQLGMAEDRGTLFHDIVRILEAKKPPVVMLENVRNLAGPRQRASWTAVVDGLRRAGYQVSRTPLVFSPHLLSPDAGGTAQLRERLYILGHYVGPDAVVDAEAAPVVENKPQSGWHPSRWRVEDHVLLSTKASQPRKRYDLDPDEVDWVDTWNRLLSLLGPTVHLPGHPLWEQEWRPRRTTLAGLPDWKQALVRKNHDFYLQHRTVIDAWRTTNPALRAFPASRRKLEWQAGQGDGVQPRDLWAQLLHFRPSGIRAKQPTYAPTLVAMNQASVFGPLKRRLTPLEAARLQGFDSSFTFGDQVDSLSYKQMGNAVNVGAARYVLDKYVRAHDEVISVIDHRGAALVEAVLRATPQVVEAGTAASA